MTTRVVFILCFLLCVLGGAAGANTETESLQICQWSTETYHITCQPDGVIDVHFATFYAVSNFVNCPNGTIPDVPHKMNQSFPHCHGKPECTVTNEQAVSEILINTSASTVLYMEYSCLTDENTTTISAETTTIDPVVGAETTGTEVRVTTTTDTRIRDEATTADTDATVGAKKEDSSDSSNAGVVGAAVGLSVVLVCLVLILLWLIKRRRARSKEEIKPTLPPPDGPREDNTAGNDAPDELYASIDGDGDRTKDGIRGNEAVYDNAETYGANNAETYGANNAIKHDDQVEDGNNHRDETLEEMYATVNKDSKKKKDGIRPGEADEVIMYENDDLYETTVTTEDTDEDVIPDGTIMHDNDDLYATRISVTDGAVNDDVIDEAREETNKDYSVVDVTRVSVNDGAVNDDVIDEAREEPHKDYSVVDVESGETRNSQNVTYYNVL